MANKHDFFDRRINKDGLDVRIGDADVFRFILEAALNQAFKDVCQKAVAVYCQWMGGKYARSLSAHVRL